MSSYDNPNLKMEWRNNGDNTYWVKKRIIDGSPEQRPIPWHPKIREMYDFVYTTAFECYCSSEGGWDNIKVKLVEKYGEISEEIMTYLYSCPYDCGSRCGLLKEDPHFYD